MVSSIFKTFCGFINEKRVKIYITHLIFPALYWFFFFFFQFFRYSELITAVLRIAHFFMISFFTVPVLAYLDGAQNFRKAIRDTCKNALFFSVFTLGINTGLLYGIRFFVARDRLVFAGIFVFFLLSANIAFVYVPAILSGLHDRFFSSLKKSAFTFIQYPLITLLLFVIQVFLRIVTFFTLFIVPTWIFAELFFLISLKIFSRNEVKK